MKDDATVEVGSDGDPDVASVQTVDCWECVLLQVWPKHDGLNVKPPFAVYFRVQTPNLFRFLIHEPREAVAREIISKLQNSGYIRAAGNEIQEEIVNLAHDDSYPLVQALNRAMDQMRGGPAA